MENIFDKMIEELKSPEKTRLPLSIKIGMWASYALIIGAALTDSPVNKLFAILFLVDWIVIFLWLLFAI